MSYYKYAERDASAQVNWAEIGKNLTQTLQDEVKVREDKKAAIDAATREYDNTLNTAPQGEFQDGNKFTNDYVAQQQKIRMMDDALLKSGNMDLNTYTMRRQNGVDGTNQLFDLQKKFQSVYSERIKGVMDGSLTAQNAFEMSQVQGFGDFSKAQAMINNVDGRVNIGMTEMGEDGIKRVVPNSAIPVNVLMGKIQTPLQSFDVNAETKRLVDSQGELVLSLYEAGSYSGAGNITELTGLDAIEKFGEGKWTEAAKKVNDAIQNSVNAMLSNPRNLPSLLTGQVGGYSAESFTYNKDEAAKDKNKILLKSSTDGSPGVMDENGPNYKEQKAKAENWLTTSIKSQMDAKVSKKETSQADLQESEESKRRAEFKYRAKGEDETPPPASTGEILTISAKSPQGKRVVTGVSQKIQGLVSTEVKGINNVATDIGYNHKNGTLVISGYQVSGKESEGTKTPIGEDGEITKTEGSSVSKKQYFKTNDIKNAALLSVLIKKIPNPETGYNFSNIAEAKDYYKRAYKSRAVIKKTSTFDAEKFYNNYKATK